MKKRRLLEEAAAVDVDVVVVAGGNYAAAAVAVPRVCPNPVAADVVIAAVIGYVTSGLRS